MTSVLIAYGSKRGSTGQIAKAIGWTFEEMGLDVVVRPAAEVEDVAPYDAVVLGGAVYLNRWHRDARRFGRRFVGALRDRPVWLFSSGPLDLTAEEREIPRFRSSPSSRSGSALVTTRRSAGGSFRIPVDMQRAPWPSGWRETTGTSLRSVRGPPASVVKSTPEQRQ